jgi:hypothetical protein
MSYDTVCYDCGLHKMGQTREAALAEETCHYADTGHDVKTYKGGLGGKEV